MTLDELRQKCAKDAGFKKCEECPLFNNTETCWEYLSTYVFPEKCEHCNDDVYIFEGDEPKYVASRFCPVCGRSKTV